MKTNGTILLPAETEFSVAHNALRHQKISTYDEYPITIYSRSQCYIAYATFIDTNQTTTPTELTRRLDTFQYLASIDYIFCKFLSVSTNYLP